jgi:serine/threonine-protein kinase RsbW
MGQTDDATGDKPVRMVNLTLLADQDYLPLARTSAMHVAALLYLPLPRVDDLRLAVDEACSSFLRTPPQENVDEAPSASVETMELSYDRYPAHLHVTVQAPAPHGWPESGELGWEVLSCLVGEVRVSVRDGIGVLTLIEPLPAPAGF